MARRNLPVEEESDNGAPEWMVTFSDCMTLLLTFFVLLLTFSSFDSKDYKKLKVIYSSMLDSITQNRRSGRDALNYIPPVRYINEIDEGSEKPTNSPSMNDGLLNEQQSDELNNGMVFLLPSDDLFWGRGSQVTTEGRELLNDIAEFIVEVPNRIVISETGGNESPDDVSRGLERSWAVIYYLCTNSSKHDNIEKDRFSISISGTLTSQNFTSQNSATEHMLEISLLEGSIYN